MDEQSQELTPKELRFINFYVGESHFNGADAARRAGYSEKYARQTAREILAKPYIRTRVDAVLAAECLSAQEVLHELRSVALAPTTHFMQVVAPEQRNDGGQVIAPMTVRQDYGAKMKALELAGKAHKLFVDRAEVSGPDGGDINFTINFDRASQEEADDQL